MKNISLRNAVALTVCCITLLIVVLLWQVSFFKPAPQPPARVSNPVVGLNVPPGDGQPSDRAQLAPGGNAGLPPMPAEPLPGTPGWLAKNASKKR